jgi:hypothetical protein
VLDVHLAREVDADAGRVDEPLFERLRLVDEARGRGVVHLANCHGRIDAGRLLAGRVGVRDAGELERHAVVAVELLIDFGRECLDQLRRGTLTGVLHDLPDFVGEVGDRGAVLDEDDRLAEELLRRVDVAVEVRDALLHPVQLLRDATAPEPRGRVGPVERQEREVVVDVRPRVQRHAVDADRVEPVGLRDGVLGALLRFLAVLGAPPHDARGQVPRLAHFDDVGVVARVLRGGRNLDVRSVLGEEIDQFVARHAALAEHLPRRAVARLFVIDVEFVDHHALALDLAVDDLLIVVRVAPQVRVEVADAGPEDARVARDHLTDLVDADRDEQAVHEARELLGLYLQHVVAV